MIGFVQKIIKQRFLGFSLVGGGVFLLGFFLLWLQIDVLGLNQTYAALVREISLRLGFGGDLNLDLTGKVVANLITTVVAVESNFFLNKFVNWRERKGAWGQQWLKFHVTRLATIVLNQFLSALIVVTPFFDLTWQGKNYDYLVAAVLTTLLGTAINFLGNDKFVFREKIKSELVRSE